MITYICRIVFHYHACAAYLYPSVDDVAVPDSLYRPYLFDSTIFLKKQKTERLIEVIDRQSAVSHSSTSASFIKTKTIGVTGKSFNLKEIFVVLGILLAIPRGCLPSQKVADKIKQWLDTEELDCVVLIGEFARNTLFSYHVTLSSGTEITVFQPSYKKDSIIVSATLFLADDKVKRLRKKPKDIQEKTFSKVLIKLAPLDVELTLEGGEIYQRIGINHKIYFDGLTKDRFFRSISTVNRAYRLVEWILEQSI